MQHDLLTDIHFYARLKRMSVVRTTIIMLILWLTVWPRLFIRLFLRRGMGRRYASLAGCLVLVFILFNLPVWYYFDVRPWIEDFVADLFRNDRGLGSLVRPDPTGFSELAWRFGWPYYLLVLAFAALAYFRRKECVLPAGVFDPNTHSYNPGAMRVWMFAPRLPRIRLAPGKTTYREYKLRLPYPIVSLAPFKVRLGWLRLYVHFPHRFVSTRTAQVLVEPLTFFLASLLSFLLDWVIGRFFGLTCFPEAIVAFSAFCSVVYWLSSHLAYIEGDNMILDKLDEQYDKIAEVEALHEGALTDEQRKQRLLQGRMTGETMGGIFSQRNGIPRVIAR